MLNFKIENDKVVEVSIDFPEDYKNWVNRNNFESLEAAEKIAAEASELTNELYIAYATGHYPAFDVFRAPAVGDEVSYGFNGDYRPDGKIVKISKTMKVVTTDSGNRYYRQRESAQWLMDGTWSLINGHIDERNPSF